MNKAAKQTDLERYFSKYCENIIGDKHCIKTPYHESVRIVYADWTASGRMYLPIEQRIRETILPLVANTHTETNDTGLSMTYAYHKAQQIIKKHCGASDQDILISSNSGMTGVVNKFQRILGLKLHESFKNKISIPEAERPIVFITHMEHHSNQTSWIETIADVEIIAPDETGLVSLDNFQQVLEKYRHRKTKIAAVTSCSNVTGIMTPYLDIAAMIHKENGVCFVDFACSAPYVEIDMHPDDAAGRYLDAIYFSPHKFLGGPGSTGVLIFNKRLYSNIVPDDSGGGTVDWTNPWGQHKYLADIESREDGGTPAFLQTIKAAMCVKLKEEIGVENIHKREEEMLDIIWEALPKIPNLHVLAGEHRERLGVFSFYIDNLHYNVIVKLLNDKFGVQMRGGCSCAGTYGHYLLHVTQEISNSITCQIDDGDYSTKPGWVRMSIHPTQSNEDIYYILDAIKQVAEHYHDWIKDYTIDLSKNIIKHKDLSSNSAIQSTIDKCFFADFAV